MNNIPINPSIEAGIRLDKKNLEVCVSRIRELEKKIEKESDSERKKKLIEEKAVWEATQQKEVWWLKKSSPQE